MLSDKRGVKNTGHRPIRRLPSIVACCLRHFCAVTHQSWWIWKSHRNEHCIVGTSHIWITSIRQKTTSLHSFTFVMF